MSNSKIESPPQPEPKQKWLSKRNSDETFYISISESQGNNVIVTEKIDGCQVNFVINNDGNLVSMFSHHKKIIEKTSKFNGMKEVHIDSFIKSIKGMIIKLKELFPTFQYITIHTEFIQGKPAQTFKGAWENKTCPYPSEWLFKFFIFEIKITFQEEGDEPIRIRPYQEKYQTIFEGLLIPEKVYKGILNCQGIQTICKWMTDNFRTVEGCVIFIPDKQVGHKFRTGWTDAAPTTLKIIEDCPNYQEFAKERELTPSEQSMSYVVDMYHATRKPARQPKNQQKQSKKPNKNNKHISEWIDSTFSKVIGHLGHTLDKYREHTELVRKEIIEGFIAQYEKDNSISEKLQLQYDLKLVRSSITYRLNKPEAFFNSV